MEWSQIAAYATAGFERAAANFSEKPNADNWGALLRAALVHQQVRMCATTARSDVLYKLRDVKLIELDDRLVEFISGQSIKSLLP